MQTISIPELVVDSEKKQMKERKRKKQQTRSKMNKSWRAIAYHGMTLFLVFTCNKERVHKRPSVTIVNTNGYILFKFPIDIWTDSQMTLTYLKAF